MTPDGNVLLKVEDLTVRYPGRRARHAPPAVDSVSFEIKAGETLGLVGESGSGKTTIGRALLGLIPVSDGRITLNGVDITHHRDFVETAPILQAVFQDPFSSLNPRRTTGDALSQSLRHLTTAEATDAVTQVLERVGLPADTASRYPAMFSGGQRQRIAIARALLTRPKLIVCDEPTSALDVSTQAAVLELLSELQEETGTAYLFITHDLAVVRRFADRVAVLRSGKIVETGDTEQVCTVPEHPYTERLLISAPVPDPAVQRERRKQRLALERADRERTSSEVVEL